MTGYKSLNPERVHQLVSALRGASAGARSLDGRFGDLVAEGEALGGTASTTFFKMPLSMVGLLVSGQADSYHRRVTHFEQMLATLDKGLPVGAPQTWFNDFGTLDQKKIEAAVKAAMEFADANPFALTEARNGLMTRMRGMTLAEIQAMMDALDDPTSTQLLRRMSEHSWLFGGTEGETREFYNLIGESVNMATISRLGRLSKEFTKYYRPSTAGTGFANYHWDTVTGTLFIKGPEQNDVDQRSVGDCGLQATLAAIAQKRPGFLRRMITENPNGSYTVTFQNKGRDPVKIVVQPEMLYDAQGNPLTGFGDTPDDPNRNELWSVVVEKAAAQWRGGYKDIQGRWPADWMEEITGASADRIEADDVESTNDVQKLLDSGKSVTLSTQDPKDHPGMNDVKPKSLFGPHAYTVIGVKDGKVLLQNPWGSGEGTTEVSLAELKKYGTRVEAVDVP